MLKANSTKPKQLGSELQALQVLFAICFTQYPVYASITWEI